MRRVSLSANYVSNIRASVCGIWTGGGVLQNVQLSVQIGPNKTISIPLHPVQKKKIFP